MGSKTSFIFSSIKQTLPSSLHTMRNAYSFCSMFISLRIRLTNTTIARTHASTHISSKLIRDRDKTHLPESTLFLFFFFFSFIAISKETAGKSLRQSEFGQGSNRMNTAFFHKPTHTHMSRLECLKAQIALPKSNYQAISIHIGRDQRCTRTHTIQQIARHSLDRK